MTRSSLRRKASPAQRALYAPKPKPPSIRPQPRPLERHLVPDEVLRKTIQRTLGELKLPGKIPSEVIFGALAEIRELVERAALAMPNAIQAKDRPNATGN